MASVNKVILIGNVGRDPEVRYLDGQGAQTKVATFTLATSERYKDRSGELRENTEWHNIVVWRQQADVAEKFIRKGSQIYVEGRLRTRSWTDAQGVKKYQTEVNVDTLQLLGRKDGDQNDYQGGNQGYSQPARQQSAPSYGAPAPQPAYGDSAQAYSAPAQQPAAPAAEPSDDLPF